MYITRLLVIMVFLIMRRVLLLATCLLLAAPSFASHDNAPPSASGLSIGLVDTKPQLVKLYARTPVSRCVLQSAKKYKLDPYLIWAIKQVESGNSLKADIVGVNTNGTRDLGLMQINNGVWVKEIAKFGISEKDLFDPCINIEVGSWILASSIQKHGVREGIGRYHSGTPKYKNVYIDKVYAKWSALLKKAYP